MPDQPTLKDVAARVGVHPATASKALNPETRHLVSDRTARRVIAAARRLGYRPNSIARGLRTNRSFAVGVVIPDLTNPLFPPIVRGVENALAGRGYTALLANTDNDPEREETAIASLRSRQVDGFIVATARRHHPLLLELAEAGVPIVLANRFTERREISGVGSDEVLGIDLAVRHLVDLGHRRIAHLAGPQELSTGHTRLRAFLNALAFHGLSAGPHDVEACQSYSEQAGADATRRLLERVPEVTAVVAATDVIALGCYTVLEEEGLACPKRLSVVGYNDTPFVERLRPALTSVRIPHYQIGVEAGRMLMERITDATGGPKCLLLPPSLAVRESTAPPAGVVSS